MTSRAENIRLTLRNICESIFHFWKEWIRNHPSIIRIYTIFSWISLIAFVLSFFFMEDSRKMFVQFFWSFYLLLQFWLLCRSKTLTWKQYTYFFMAGAWLIVPLNSVVVRLITTVFGGVASDVWSQAILTPIAEEMLKLIPLGVYLFLSRRASTLSLSDYALIGAASGAGFQFIEETTRRLISGEHYGVTLLQGKVLHWDLFTLFPGYFEEGFLPDKMSAGHALLTAMVTLGIGLAVRYKHRFNLYTYLFPIFLLAWSIFDHAIWNASYGAPDWLTGIHDLLGSGYASKTVFLIMLAVVLFIDYWELNRVREKIPLLTGEGVINPVSEFWNLITSAFENRERFGYLLLFYRERRELGFTLLRGTADTEGILPRLDENIKNYYKALTVISIVLFTVLFLSELTYAYDSPDACFACLFDSLQNWWDRLSGWEKGLIVLGAFALTFPLLGFWSAIGVVSTGIGLAGSGHQFADVIRNPKKLLTPETALALGVSALLSRIPFGRALERAGDWVSSKIKPIINKIIGRHLDKPRNKDDHGNQKSPDKSDQQKESDENRKEEETEENKNIDKAKVGDFTTIKDLDDFRSRIPDNATQLPWKEIPGGAVEGEKYRWTDQDGNVWNVRAHGPDPSAPDNSNAAKGWIYRVELKSPSGKWTMDSQGNFYKKNVFNPKSPFYDEAIANDSHIPFTG